MPFFWCYAHPFTAPLGLKIGSFRLLVVDSFFWQVWRNIIHWEEYNIDSFFSLTLGFAWCHFYTFAIIFLHGSKKNL